LSRESVIKATAAALQPKALDLTQFRQRSARDSTVKVKTDDAAGALAFAALDREDGPGDALRPILLRLKYADQRTKPIFIRALMLLLGRHGYDAQKPSDTLYALATVALFEWLNDACVKCRATSNSRPKARRGIGMRCLACQNSGRFRMNLKQRWKMVSEVIGDMQVQAGQGRRGLPLEAFRDRWTPAYLRLLNDLQACDRSMVASVDLRFTASVRSEEAEDIDPIEVEEGEG
jgi:hypothetical protein